jgi:hypothetical protein
MNFSSAPGPAQRVRDLALDDGWKSLAAAGGASIPYYFR